jgi:hypothetical protein
MTHLSWGAHEAVRAPAAASCDRGHLKKIFGLWRPKHANLEKVRFFSPAFL